MKYVLDASAVIAFIKDETGGDVVEKILLSESCCIHSANWIELFYISFSAPFEIVQVTA